MRALLVILCSLSVAYALSFFLVVPANPEVTFWEEAVRLRQSDLAEIRKSQPDQPVILFTGGSSCAFSIDPAIIEQKTGLPAVNLGLPVACGHGYIIHQALEKSRPGDFLVLCLEPDLLTYPVTDKYPSSTAFRLATALGHTAEAAGGDSTGSHLALNDYLNHLRPGARYIITLAGRHLTGKGYRYTLADLRDGGRVETPVTNPELHPGGLNTAATLTIEGRAMLQTVVETARRRGVRVAYAMPWVLTSREFRDANRSYKQSVLKDIATILPVIEDGYSGVNADTELFSDSVQHLTDQGAALRSEALARPLVDWLRSSEIR